MRQAGPLEPTGRLQIRIQVTQKQEADAANLKPEPKRAGAQVAAMMGKEGDATPFTDVTVDNISAALHKCGYQSRGWEVMYSGHTGRQLHAQIFLNPTYYQRLKHMVRPCRHRNGCSGFSHSSVPQLHLLLSGCQAHNT